MRVLKIGLSFTFLIFYILLIVFHIVAEEVAFFILLFPYPVAAILLIISAFKEEPIKEDKDLK